MGLVSGSARSRKVHDQEPRGLESARDGMGGARELGDEKGRGGTTLSLGFCASGFALNLGRRSFVESRVHRRKDSLSSQTVKCRRVQGLQAVAAPPDVTAYGWLTNALVGPLFDAVNTSSPEWLRYVVWIDFRFAVLLFVFTPLYLFGASFWEESDALKRVMIGYWQASSMLMLTVFLNIAEQPFGTFTGFFVQIMIPIALWWWKDLVEEIEQQSTPLARFFKAWRWPTTLLAAAGGTTQFTLQRCNFVPRLVDDPICAAWLEPPFKFKSLLLPFVPTQALEVVALAGVTIYFTYLTYYVAVPLRRVGRSGRQERECFSSVSLLRSWGWLAKAADDNSYKTKGESGKTY